MITRSSRTRYFPAFSSLTLAVIFAGLWIYALYATGNTAIWIRWFIALVIATVSLVGVSAAIRLRGDVIMRALYIIGALLTLSGVASFYMFTAPTTINIFGFLAIVVGMAISGVASAIIATLHRPGA